MRSSHLTSTALAAIAVVVGALAPLPAQSQQPKGAPAQQAQPGPQDQQSLAPPKAYKPVAIKLPQAVQTGFFDSLRNPWVLLGLVGQAVFSLRFLVQWIESGAHGPEHDSRLLLVPVDLRRDAAPGLRTLA